MSPQTIGRGKLVNSRLCPYPVCPRLVLKIFVLDKKFPLYFDRRFFVFLGSFLPRRIFCPNPVLKFLNSRFLWGIYQKKIFGQNMSRTKILRTSLGQTGSGQAIVFTGKLRGMAIGRKAIFQSL